MKSEQRFQELMSDLRKMSDNVKTSDEAKPEFEELVEDIARSCYIDNNKSNLVQLWDYLNSNGFKSEAGVILECIENFENFELRLDIAISHNSWEALSSVAELLDDSPEKIETYYEQIIKNMALSDDEYGREFMEGCIEYCVEKRNGALLNDLIEGVRESQCEEAFETIFHSIIEENADLAAEDSLSNIPAIYKFLQENDMQTTAKALVLAACNNLLVDKKAPQIFELEANFTEMGLELDTVKLFQDLVGIYQKEANRVMLDEIREVLVATRQMGYVALVDKAIASIPKTPAPGLRVDTIALPVEATKASVSEEHAASPSSTASPTSLSSLGSPDSPKSAVSVASDLVDELVPGKRQEHQGKGRF